jgi:hypothetical protein
MGLRQVAIAKGDAYVTVSLQDFVAMPLDERVRLILEQQVRFYDEQGTLMSTADGLRILRKMRHASAPGVS